VNLGQQAAPKSSSDEREQDAEWRARYRSRERAKIVGLFVIIIFILALVFLRFGRTIPWGAR
jgi:uncharacterized membrane protein